MKVLIDGYNLGLSHGTGIATYGYQLANLLNKNNHHVSCLYELSGLNLKSDGWSNFIQKLNTNKEGTTKKNGISKIGIISSIVKNYGNYLFDLPIAIKKIEKNNDIFNSLPNKIPNLTGIYNSNYVYKFSLIMNKIHGGNTLIKSGDIKYDLLHLTSPLPIRYQKIPKIVTIHDIIPIVAPDTTLANIKNYRKLIKNSISDADEIIVVSNKSKHDLLNNFDLKEEKVHVTYQSVFIPEHFKLIEENFIRMFLQNNYGLKFKEFFLFYGAIEPKKNIRRLLEAFSITKTDYPLVIVGKDGWLYDDVKNFFKNANKNKFKRINYLPFSHLMMLLKSAKALIFPSVYEGFGLPVLEAMLMGCPVITSNTTSIPEIGGDAVSYIDPMDVNDIARKIDLISGDQKLCEQLIERGYVQSEKFSPENHYKRLIDVYNRCV